MSHAWMPTSPCGPGCLTGDEPTVGRVRAAGRLCRTAGVLVTALALAPVVGLLPRSRRASVLRRVFRGLLRAVGVRLAVRNAAGLRPVPGRGALVVHNHISWLDIVAINGVRPMRALAKREVRGWPLIGALATAAGSVYLDRERLRTLPGTMTELAGVLRGGSMVTVTPEGTTWCGQASGRFRTATFQAAIDAGVPVIPVALRFRAAGGRETSAPAFIGAESLVESIRRVVRLRGLVLELEVLPELRSERAADRRELAALAEASVDLALGRTLLRAEIPYRSARLDLGRARGCTMDW
ncbi:MAG TPA: lysophospholipid acyltransferase family protein [Actinophytocola sp.]|uniref:lysophospholipid acyltransferase family protein n=1 Tax=Actinophytocola sp. TaxID=1872138 RepID=UPI002DBCA287|nr:lysophospholipid acyltransferase family protein [Actinophytocola sp.]HEU5470125.1 lysophospholipid acyltransferase family protein [Actinophytocola sp.]